MKKQRVESIGNFCELLGRSRLLAGDEVRLIEQRWRREAGHPDDLGAFTRWLAANQYATEFQVAMLLHGHFAHLRLGPYKLLERIGRGRQAMVYKAVHRLGRTVAIKVLIPSRARDPHLLARFQREAQLAQGLQHPNVVRTLEGGEADGLHYLVMEYLAGQTLQEALEQRGRLELEEAVDVVYQALLGLQHLHDRGLVHCNLEPANLMLIQTGASGGDPRLPEGPRGPLVKILDISMSRSAAGSDVEASPEGQDLGRLMYEGLLLREPGYLAPEQARDASAVDIRADIYSLGCILYHALAGQVPHQDGSPLQQIIRHATETPRPLRECNPEVPEGLELIVNWMMAKEPAQRYQTPERAAGALTTFLFGERSALAAAEFRPDSRSASDGSLPEWPENEGKETAPIPAEEPDTGAYRDTTADARPAAEACASPGSFEFAAPESVRSTWQEDGLFSSLIPDGHPPLDQQRSSGRGEGGHASSRQQKRLGRRDYLLLALGAGGLLAVQTIGWLLGKASRKPRGGTGSDPENRMANRAIN
jgi:eukaryotic-like serine/threonine-protein kinase